MLTPGHIAASYLLAETSKIFGLTLTNKEILSIIIAGNVVDFDFITGLFTGKTGETHHQNLTHTPFGISLLFFGWCLLFKSSLSLSILIFISMFIHLVLDELGYWTYRLKLIKVKINPQINWLYPFRPFPKIKLIESNKKVLKYYLFKVWPIAVIELILVIVALVIFLITFR